MNHRPGSRDPPGDRGMGVQEELLDVVRVPLGQIQIPEPVHGSDEGLWITRRSEREIIGLALDVARPSIREGEGNQSKGHEDETEQRQSTQVSGTI